VAEVVVVDIETTGLGEYDRIIEVAGIIYETEDSSVIGEFETLVNPLRSISTGTSLKSHNLRAEHLSAAPTFHEVGPWLAKIFHRRPVIHFSNGFDNRMLNQDFIWADIDFRLVQVASALLPGAGNLFEVCARGGHDLREHHSAIADARAALAVASHIGWDRLLSSAGRTEHLADSVLVTSHRTLSRFQAGLTQSFDLTRFERGAEFRDLKAEDAYLFLLDELLEDMALSADELATLDEFASRNGMNRQKQDELHQKYLADIETAVLRNGYVSPGEMNLVTKFSTILGVETSLKVSEEGEITLSPGSLISTTGTAVIDGVEMEKEKLGAIVRDLGFRFTTDFRKGDGPSLLLIPSDGNISGKSKQARQWGIPQMTVANFLAKFGN